MVLGPKFYDMNGIRALKPYYLGLWTLRVYQMLRGLGLIGFWVQGLEVWVSESS